MQKTMSPKEAERFVKEAVIYALESRDPNLDYGKYVSKDFINTIDDKKFNFEQWVQHIKNVKKTVVSLKPIFEYCVSDGKHVALYYQVHSTKKEGSMIKVKDMALFIIENGKIVYCDELTKLLEGGEDAKHFASMS